MSIQLNGNNESLYSADVSIGSTQLNADGTADFGGNVSIDSSGRLLVGTSSTPSTGQGNVSNFVVQGYTGNPNNLGLVSIQRGEAATSIGSSETIGRISFNDSDGNSFGWIQMDADADAGASDFPGRLVFSTTADGASSPTEQMRIKSNGDVCINGTDATNYDQTSGDGQVGWNSAQSSLAISHNNSSVFSPIYINKFNFTAGSSNDRFITWYVNGSSISSITTNGTSIAYNTGSDYRLKENVVPLTGAIDRLNQLQVRRFNFIADPDTTVDGFLAHEAQTVVPEAITGEKDAVDDDGNPEYQGIDQSKLVPLLTAALQEAIGRIETLESKVQTLKGGAS